MEEALFALDKEHCCHAGKFNERLHLMEEAHHHHAASLQATVSAAISCTAEQRCHAAAAQTAASAELALAEECRSHDAATQMVMSAVSSFADEHHCHEAVGAQATELAVLLLAEERRRHDATELATMSAMRSLTTSRDHADIKAITYKAPVLSTTTLPEPPAMLSPSPRPSLSYLGAVLNTNGGGAFVVAFNVAYRGGSNNNTFRRQRQTTSDPPPRPTSLSHRTLPPSLRSQPSRQGASLIPYTNVGGRVYIVCH